MKPSSLQSGRRHSFLRSKEQARATIFILLLVVFLLGLGAGAFWFRHSSRSLDAGSQRDIVLSDHTRSVLINLKSPVEIRFYSLLGDASMRDSLGGFSRRVDDLIAEYEREAGGNIRVTRLSTPSGAEMDAAMADGIAPFNRERGDVCYLGVVVVQGGQKESIPQLLPEWEPALESDLTRAIMRVTQPGSAQQPVAMPAEVTPATTEEVKRLIPNADSVTVEQGTAMLREAARKEFTEAATKLQARLKKAEDHYTEVTQTGNSESERQAALREIQTIQAERTQLLDEIGLKYRAQQAAFEHLKNAAR